MNDDPFPGLFAGQRQGPIAAPYAEDVVRAAIREVVGPLTEQLDVANRHLDEERARADRAERRADEAQAEARDALTPERIARDEAAGLRAELDARRVWGLWRRVRGR